LDQLAAEVGTIRDVVSASRSNGRT